MLLSKNHIEKHHTIYNNPVILYNNRLLTVIYNNSNNSIAIFYIICKISKKNNINSKYDSKI